MRGHQFDLVDQQVRRTNARATAGHGLTAAVGAGTITAVRAVVLVNADVFERHAETFGDDLRHRRLRTVPLRLRGAHGIDLAGARKSVVSGKSVSVRVDLGGPRIIKKKK